MAEITVDEELVYTSDKLFCPQCRAVITGMKWESGVRCPDDKAKLSRLTWKQEAEMLGRLRDRHLEERENWREMIRKWAPRLNLHFN